MTTQELLQLDHISVDQHDHYVAVTPLNGYCLHTQTTQTTTDPTTGEETTQTQHAYATAIAVPIDCDTLPDYDIVSDTERILADTDGITLEEVKRQVKELISEYDASPAVNGFVLNGATVWLDKATRVGLMNSTTIAKSMGSETTTLWLGETKLEIPCDKAIQLLSALEMYALECFNVTAAHQAAVSELTDIAAVIAYDYKQGYPTQLNMSV